MTSRSTPSRKSFFHRKPGAGLRSAAPFALAAFSAVVLLAFLFSGCAARKETYRKAYNATLDRWTRTANVYEGMEMRLHMNATFKDISFRRAYIDRYAERYSVAEGYKAALNEKETSASDEYNEFFITASTPQERWNDFDRADSVWKLYLEDSSGAKLSPVSIVKVDPSDPLLREFFPHFDLWSRGYVVKFPKYSETGEAPIPSADTEYLKLSVTGILGKGELVWRLKEPTD